MFEFILKLFFFFIIVILFIAGFSYGYMYFSLTPTDLEIIKIHSIKTQHVLTNISCIKINYFKDRQSETELDTETVVLSKLNKLSRERDLTLECLNDTSTEDVLNLTISIPTTAEIQYISSLKDKYKLWPEVLKSSIRLYFMDNIIIKVNDISLLSQKIKLFKNVSNDELEKFIFGVCKNGFTTWTRINIPDNIKNKFCENKFVKEFDEVSCEVVRFNNLKQDLGLN